VLVVTFVLSHFLKILLSGVVIISFVGHISQIIFCLGTVFLGILHIVQVLLCFLGFSGFEVGVSIIEIESFQFRPPQIILIHSLIPSLGKGIFSAVEIIIGHVLKSRVPLGTCWKSLYKVFHQFICTGLAQSNSGIGNVICTVGLNLFVFHFILDFI